MTGFFELNTIIIIFIYGIIFFLLGFGIILKNKQHSRFKLVKALKWLAFFGILHALADWGHLFIPIQEGYSSYEAYVFLKIVRIIVNTASFMFLLQFGLSLLINIKKIPEKFKCLPAVIFFLWLTQFLVYNAFFKIPENDLWWVRVSDIWSRYLFALPGSLLAGYGIYMQKDDFIALGHEKFIKVLIFASSSFYIYGITAGLFVPEGPLYLAQIINSDVFFKITGLPIELVRASSGLLMTFSFLKLIQVFDHEHIENLRKSQKEKAIYEERNRFAQDLHDGIIQSMYASNLQLEVVRQLIDKDLNMAKSKLDLCINNRNVIINQIRGYIGELRRTNHKKQTLKSRVEEVIEELNVYEKVNFKFIYDYLGHEIPINMSYHISLIVKEAITNVIKHAKANELEVQITGNIGLLNIEIKDDGIGFLTASKLPNTLGTKQGLKNIKERVHALNGQIKIKSQHRKGTSILIKIPMEGVVE